MLRVAALKTIDVVIYVICFVRHALRWDCLKMIISTT